MSHLVFKSICPHCHGEYDGREVTVGQSIECPYCDSVIAHTPQLERFLLLRRLGQGGVCTVYLAHDTKKNQDVALKLLNKTVARDLDTVLRFFDEAETTEIFKHPNIIQMHEFGEHAGTPYLSMDYLPGGSLDDLISSQGKLSELQVLEVGISAAKGLAHAAARGVVHRDVKPGNILFNADGEATVTDFGLCSKSTDPNPNTSDVWGTAYYVPPERLKGEKEDFRSDMYGLAASLFHAVTGRPAFKGRNLEETALKHTQGLRVSVRAVRPEITEKTAKAIERAMSGHPSHRFGSYESFIEALEKARRGFIRKNWRVHLFKKEFLLQAGRTGSILFFSLLFLTSGILHFLRPDPFVDIVPGYLPNPLLLVQISGFFEILGGGGLLLARFRLWAGYGLLVLLLAVLPANIYMLTNHPVILKTAIPDWILILRLPFQFVLMGWLFWAIQKKK